MGIVGVGKKVCVKGEKVAAAGFKLATGERAQGGGAGGVAAVDHRAVDPGGDGIGLLAGMVGAGAGSGVVLGAVEIDELGAGAGWIEKRIASGDSDIKWIGGRAVDGQIDVVIDELAPGIDECGEVAVVGGSVGVGGGDGVADGAGAG